MKTNSRMAFAMLAITFTATVAARGGEIAIDLSSLVNEPWTFNGPGGAGIINGGTFPTGSQNFGGIPFTIPAGPNNYWGAAAAADFGSGVVNVTIPVGVEGVTSVFTLINTMWSQPGPNAYLYITFTGSAGATARQPLVGGVNVRDYNNDGFQNTINTTSTVQVWTNGLGQRLDRQEYILPAEFATQVLTSVTITDEGADEYSRAVLAGLTVGTCAGYVPETVGVSSGSIGYNSSLMLYGQNVYLPNTGTTAVRGPLFLILEDLTAGVSMANKSAATACWAPLGSLYVSAIPQGSSLAAGETAVVQLGFNNPSGATISYTPLVVGSLGGAP